jgi:hypothetical protein
MTIVNERIKAGDQVVSLEGIYSVPTLSVVSFALANFSILLYRCSRSSGTTIYLRYNQNHLAQHDVFLLAVQGILENMLLSSPSEVKRMGAEIAAPATFSYTKGDRTGRSSRYTAEEDEQILSLHYDGIARGMESRAITTTITAELYRPPSGVSGHCHKLLESRKGRPQKGRLTPSTTEEPSLVQSVQGATPDDSTDEAEWSDEHSLQSVSDEEVDQDSLVPGDLPHKRDTPEASRDTPPRPQHKLLSHGTDPVPRKVQKARTSVPTPSKADKVYRELPRPYTLAENNFIAEQYQDCLRRHGVLRECCQTASAVLGRTESSISSHVRVMRRNPLWRPYFLRTPLLQDIGQRNFPQGAAPSPSSAAKEEMAQGAVRSGCGAGDAGSDEDASDAERLVQQALEESAADLNVCQPAHAPAPTRFPAPALLLEADHNSELRVEALSGDHHAQEDDVHAATAPNEPDLTVPHDLSPLHRDLSPLHRGVRTKRREFTFEEDVCMREALAQLQPGQKVSPTLCQLAHMLQRAYATVAGRAKHLGLLSDTHCSDHAKYTANQPTEVDSQPDNSVALTGTKRKHADDDNKVATPPEAQSEVLRRKNDDFTAAEDARLREAFETVRGPYTAEDVALFVRLAAQLGRREGSVVRRALKLGLISVTTPAAAAAPLLATADPSVRTAPVPAAHTSTATSPTAQQVHSRECSPPLSSTLPVKGSPRDTVMPLGTAPAWTVAYKDPTQPFTACEDALLWQAYEAERAASGGRVRISFVAEMMPRLGRSFAQVNHRLAHLMCERRGKV